MHSRRRARLGPLLTGVGLAWFWGLTDALRGLIGGHTTAVAWIPLALLAMILTQLRPADSGASFGPRMRWMLRPALAALLLPGALVLFAKLSALMPLRSLPLFGRVWPWMQAVAALGLLWRWARPRVVARPLASGRWLRPAAWGAALVTTALLISGARQASLRPAHHLARLAPGEPLAPLPSGITRTDTVQVGHAAMDLERRCQRERCTLREDQHSASESGPSFIGELPAGPLTARRDEVMDIWYFHTPSGKTVAHQTGHALEHTPGNNLASLARGLATPRYWLASAGLLLAAALVQLGRGASRASHRRALREGRQGVVHRGLVQMDDGGDDLALPRRQASLRDGTRVLVLDAASRVSFREQGQAHLVVRGAKRQLLRRVTGNIAWHRFAALTLLLLAMGPLLAARLLGM